MAGSKVYDVIVTANVSRTFQIAAWDIEEAEQKAIDMFGGGSATNYDFENVEIDWIEQSGE